MADEYICGKQHNIKFKQFIWIHKVIYNQREKHWIVILNDQYKYINLLKFKEFYLVKGAMGSGLSLF